MCLVFEVFDQNDDSKECGRDMLPCAMHVMQ